MLLLVIMILSNWWWFILWICEEYFDCNGDCLNDADADGLCDELEVVGCSLDWADNYDSLATDFDDSICFRLGCTYNLADNFDSLATTDDGSCNLGDAYDAIVQAFAICQEENDTLTVQLDECLDNCSTNGVQVVIDIPEGWSFFGHVEGPINVEDKITDHSKVHVVKDENGLIWWPEFGFNAIEVLEPGEGYQIKAKSSFTL